MLGNSKSAEIIKKNLCLSGMKLETSTYIVGKRDYGIKGHRACFFIIDKETCLLYTSDAADD